MKKEEMKETKRFQVIEDNGGGITLFVFADDGTVEYAHTGYEYVHGQLTEDLEALKNGADPKKDWDGNEEDPQGLYDELTGFEVGTQIVADNDGLYPDEMGSAARFEFGVEY